MSNSSFYSNTGITSADVSSITSAKEAAATSETNAATSATEAANSATQAATSATNAASSETNVSNSAATATTSAANASTSETNASASAATATTQASNAATSATAAAGSASTAGTSATNAASSATNAATSETNAATSETNAANSATSAATSATNAGTSETNAAASASSASGYVTSATTQANNAATSATAAATSETNAASSATAASTSASGASTSASNANTSATNAASSASQAATSAAAAALAADNFDDTYLGSNASDPTTDNDGDALNAGDLHFNTTSNTLKVYNGSAWQDAAIDSSGFVQTTGDTMTGVLAFASGQTFDGRDVSADGTKLDTIETNADVTDTANVTAAGALMDSELTNIAAVKALNQGLATTDEPSFDNTTLNAIAATISDTAVDVFVYDTSQDSDGGAWRKRTQNTSWYNEAASATRGSRKEFPAVAVIVSTTSYVTIYDGDDPDMPMWAKYNLLNHDEVKVAAFNGVLILGNNYTANSAYGGNGLVEYNYVADVTRHGMQNGSQPSYDPVTSGVKSGNFSTNIGQNSASQDRYYTLVNYVINDVAMTVLPNAPIDAATGLPVPTIAVATDGGYSIIKDDGTVVDGTCSQSLHNRVQKVKFTKDNRLAYLGFDYNLQNRSRVWRVDDIISADTVITTSAVAAQNSAEFYGNANGIVSSDKLLKISVNPSDYTYAGYVEANENTFVAGNNEGVSLVDRNKTKPSDGMVSFLASSYQTGYQVGDIKLATLSDTDATNVTGSELVTNGTFDTDTSGWTAASGTTLSLSGNELVIASSSSDYGKAYQSITLEANTTYTFTVYIAYSTNIYYTRYNLTGTGYTQTLLTDGSVTSLGWQSVTFTTPSSVPSDIVLNLSARNDVVNQRVDNISIRKAEEDRSVNGNGLQVFGTVTKSAVATGADLVGYSGFSTSNYLKGPYNPDYEVTSGQQLCGMFWVYMNSTPTNYNFFMTNRPDAAGGADWWQIYTTNSSSQVILYVLSASNTTTFTTTNSLPIGAWAHVTFTIKNGESAVYINGVKDPTTGSPVIQGSADTNNRFKIGVHHDTNYALAQGKMSLGRLSRTIPSPEQIKKIYEDEKVLFQENAQATLYGSSDAVTALAYDDTTELLHVGTSAGRSVFQGLRRVDNTTTAVGAAISASNGLVADE